MAFVFEAGKWSGSGDIPGFRGQKRIPVAILGATGSVGQRMVDILAKHPWFDIVQLSSSEKISGKPYGESVTWLLPSPIPEKVRSMPLTLPDKKSEAKIVFSALDDSVAAEIETRFAEQGVAVITTSLGHRGDRAVPLLVPEVNGEQAAVTSLQGFPHGGMIIANPNASAIGLCLALKPLVTAFGIDTVAVTTYQAVSGGGFPGVPGLSILDNVIPCPAGEEEQIEHELPKIFSQFDGGTFVPSTLKVSASCARVPVTDGNLLSVSVRCIQKPTAADVKKALVEFSPPVTKMSLPTAPRKPIHFFDHLDAPQPRFHRMLEGGMAVGVGALRQCPVFDYKFFLLVHNAIRGGAGGAVLIGELLVKEGRVAL